MMMPKMIKYVRIMRFFLAPIDRETRLRKRIEAAIANHLYEQDGLVGSFQEKGIRYEPRGDEESPQEIIISCSSVLLGMPTSLMV